MHILTYKEYNRKVDNLIYSALGFAEEHNIRPEYVIGNFEFTAVEELVEKYFPNDLDKQEKEQERIEIHLQRELETWIPRK